MAIPHQKDFALQVSACRHLKVSWSLQQGRVPEFFRCTY